jgi:hypothetical protein
MQYEKAVGRPVSDSEWESMMQAAARLPRTSSAAATRRHRWEWTGKDRALCLAALLALLAGVGMYLEAGFMFSPFIRIPLGLGLWLIALLMIRMLFSSLFILILFLVPMAAVGGWNLLARHRDYLTSTHGWVERWVSKGTTPAELVATVLILTGMFLALAGRPIRPERQ